MAWGLNPISGRAHIGLLWCSLLGAAESIAPPAPRQAAPSGRHADATAAMEIHRRRGHYSRRCRHNRCCAAAHHTCARTTLYFAAAYRFKIAKFWHATWQPASCRRGGMTIESNEMNKRQGWGKRPTGKIADTFQNKMRCFQGGSGQDKGRAPIVATRSETAGRHAPRAACVSRWQRQALPKGRRGSGGVHGAPKASRRHG